MEKIIIHGGLSITEEKDSLDYEKNEALLLIIRESFDVLVNESARN